MMEVVQTQIIPSKETNDANAVQVIKVKIRYVIQCKQRSRTIQPTSLNLNFTVFIFLLKDFKRKIFKENQGDMVINCGVDFLLTLLPFWPKCS
jgi:hypothetical protein